MSEEELQKRLEAGEKITGKDAMAYRKVFDALKREPDFHLPVNFADSVMNCIATKQESAKEYFIIAGGVLFFILATIVTYLMTDFRINADAFRVQVDLSEFQFVKNYLSFIVFGIAFLVLLQWLDKRFIRPALRNKVSPINSLLPKG